MTQSPSTEAAGSATGDVAEKVTRYRDLRDQIRAVVGDLEDEVAVMASTVCLVHHALESASWTGFYRVVADDLLRVGPYQGPLGCLEIPFGRGVCGTVAANRKSLVVADVHAFPGHIACDSEARSEVVVPVFGNNGRLVAVLDLDSHSPDAFDEVDRAGLESIAEALRPLL